MTQEAAKSNPQWANPGALGLMAFGFSTILLQVSNLGLITNVVPLVFGFFWGGVAQVIAGVIDGRRGDVFGLAAFTSYGLFWMALSGYFIFVWAGLVPVDAKGLGWMCIIFAVLSGCLAVGTFKMTKIHIFIFISVTVLFILLAGHFIGGWDSKIAGVEGIICAASAVYGGIAIVLNSKFQKTVCPLGVCK